MTTYSLATQGVLADGNEAPTKTTTLPDAMVPVNSTTLTTASIGGMLGAMSHNTPLLCKGPDGGLRWYTLDAERSTPTVPVLKAV